jgi:hypothetical protein
MRIHVSKDIQNNPLFEILESIEQNFENVQLVKMDYEYENTEPTMWRYKPIFDKESDLVLCRDIDSLPNLDEVRSTLYFTNNIGYHIHTLRTHTNHTTVPTILLAGLCGFRPKMIPFIQGFNFDQYYNHFKSSQWGLDQNSLIGLFVRNPSWTQQYFLDSPLSSTEHRVGSPLIPCKSFDQDFYRKEIEISDSLSEVGKFLDSHTIWGGEPTDIRKDKLKELLSFDYDSCRKMKDVLESSSDNIKNFYLNDV